jgi:hypothetical protein
MSALHRSEKKVRNDVVSDVSLALTSAVLQLGHVFLVVRM